MAAAFTGLIIIPQTGSLTVAMSGGRVLEYLGPRAGEGFAHRYNLGFPSPRSSMEGPAIQCNEIRRIVDDQIHFAESLVRLASFSQEEISSEVRRLRDAVLDSHLDSNLTIRSEVREVPSRIILARLESDHRIFPTSIEQLEWLLQIVRNDDHGGNRQALGQYWKLLLEALTRHLDDEDGLSLGRPPPHS